MLPKLNKTMAVLALWRFSPSCGRISPVDSSTGISYTSTGRSRSSIGFSSFLSNNSTAVKRFGVCLLIIFYTYNLFGFMFTFVAAQNKIRKEIKMRIKQSVPQEELVLFAFTADEAASLQWITSYEFRYKGGMYDIVWTRTSGDSVYYQCVNDVQEEELFKNLQEQVERQMNDVARNGGPDAFKKALDSEVAQPGAMMVLPLAGRLDVAALTTYESVHLDVPSPPPWPIPA